MSWKVLFVDDDPDFIALAHASLDGGSYRGQAFELLAADSAAAARRLMRSTTNIAVAFIDVNMESPRAGLELVKDLRESDSAWQTRLVLLTGNTDVAPELETTVQFDLDGYLDKAAMSPERLQAKTHSSVRTYDLVTRLDNSRKSVLRAVQTLSSLDQADRLTRALDQVISDLINVGDEMRVDAAWSWQSDDDFNADPDTR